MASHPASTEEATDRGTCFLTNLATELIQHIIEFIPPASHLGFARTCKHIFACSSDVLKRHHDAHVKYAISSDLDPVTIPTILRSAFGYADPVLAYHVRELELWFERTGWEHWKMLSFQTPVDEDSETVPIEWEYVYGEMEDYLSCLENNDETTLSTARDQLEAGHDGLLKALALAQCPRLRDVKFAMPGSNRLQDTCTYAWLKMLIDDAYNKRFWPPGLASLRTVAVGLKSETWMDMPHDPYTDVPNTFLLVQLLRLPQLSTLYFADHDAGVADDVTPWADMLPARSSSLKHVFFDNTSDLGSEFTEVFAQAPKALVSTSFRVGPTRLENADSLVKMLGVHQGASLESLMFYGYGLARDAWGGIHGYRCGAFRPEELDDFAVLRQLCVNVRDVELDAVYHFDSPLRPTGESDGEWLKRFFALTFQRFRSLEALVLWNGLTADYIVWEPDEERGFEDAVIGLIDGSCGLQSIYLENTERRSGAGRATPPQKDHAWFRRAVEVGRKRGVDVHTLTNTYPKRYEQRFPEAPDRYDWKTGPTEGRRPSGARPEDWVFDVYEGRRKESGRERCGDCEECLEVYPRAVWDGERRRVEEDGEVGDIWEEGKEDDTI